LVFNGQTNRNPWVLNGLSTTLDTITYLTASASESLGDSLNWAGWQWRQVVPTKEDGFGYRFASYVPKRMSTLIIPNARFGHSLGIEVADASVPGGMAWYAGDSSSPKQGHIVFGGYSLLPAGKYQARFWIKSPISTLAQASLIAEVMKNNGQEVAGVTSTTLAATNQSMGYKPVEVSFEVKVAFAEAHEFRLFINGTAPITFSHVEVEQVALPSLVP
jgi:hypothetical protein